MEYIQAKTIVTKTKSTNWFGADYNMNIYRGCPHGCIYCDSRSDCYRIKNFDKVVVKEKSTEIIANELSRKRKKGVISTGSMSDPYNPFEKKEKLTRSALKLIDKYKFGVTIATKSNLIIRDIDILNQIKIHSPVIAKITVTTFNDSMSKIIEPHSPLSSERFSALKILSENNIFSGILLMPILPFITDTEENIVNIIKMTKENGGKFIYPAFGVTLRDNQREYYFTKLEKYFPGLKEKYIQNFGNSYFCNSRYSKKLYNIFKTQCEKEGLIYKMSDIILASRKPTSGFEQINLF